MSDNTKSSLDSLFKYKVAKEVNELVPSFAIIQEMMGDLSPATKAGRKFLWPVALTLENGVTYGDGTVFSYNGAIAAVYGEAQIDAAPIVVQSRVSLSAANTMLDDEATFVTETKLRAGTMKESLTKRLEIECLYGKSAVGIGVVSSQSGSSTTRAITLTDATFAAAIWGGMENCLLENRDGSGTKLNTNADIVLVSVDVDNKKLNVSGNATDLDAIVATTVLWFKGQYSNGFAGIHKQLTNSSTLFNIDAGTYQLWKASSYAVTGALTMAKSLRGLAKAVGKGGLTGNVVELVAPETYEGLNSDLSALRMFDSSYGSDGTSGFEGITYRYQGGKVKIVAHPYCMPGYAYAGPEKGIRKIGRVDINFGMGGDDYFEKLEGSAGYQLLCQAEWSCFIEKPARWVIFTGITNAA